MFCQLILNLLLFSEAVHSFNAASSKLNIKPKDITLHTELQLGDIDSDAPPHRRLLLQLQRLQRQFKNGRFRQQGLLLKPPPPPPIAQFSSVQKLVFEQRLDHFDPGNVQKWNQVYLMSAEHYKPGGPIFLFVNGEAPLSPGWMTKGDWVNNAQRFNAMMFMLEHRYYGSSIPTSDCSQNNLLWLSSAQALADLANFITSMKQKHPELSTAKVMVFGGSYAGNLAAWLRIKYPDVVDGAVASSAPVRAKADFSEYLEVVTEAVDFFSADCSKRIRRGFKELDAIFDRASLTANTGCELLKQKLQGIVCAPIPNMCDEDYRAELYEQLYRPWQMVTQYNRQLGNLDLRFLCDQMKQPGDAFKNLFRIASGSCINVHWESSKDNVHVTSACSSERSWMYQTCTEFGYYQTTDSKRQVFGSSVPLRHEERIHCETQFNISDIDVASAVKHTNEAYGGTNITATNLVLVNGSLDPWSRLSVINGSHLAQIGAGVVPILIKGTSHCFDMTSEAPTDIPQLQKAKQRISDEISTWLS